MEKMSGENPVSEPDAVSHEAHKLFTEYQADMLQQAAHIDRALEVIASQIEAGKLSPQMTLAEALEILEETKDELLGPDDDSEEDSSKSPAP